VLRKLIITFIIVAFISVLAIVFLAKRNISNDDPQILIVSQKISKALIMRVLDVIESVADSTGYAPTPFDSPDFSYADLSHPYFDEIRNDKRVAHFYSGEKGNVDFYHAISMREYLRDLFPHGAASRNYLHENVLEMIDAAEHGERYLCGNISKMLVQMIQAGGAQARTVGLQASDSGHVVVEMWSEKFGKWVVLDPDYNVHYTNTTGTPLSAIELYQMSQDSSKIKDIMRVPGKSVNTLYSNNSKLVEQYYKNGIAINYYNRWVDKDLPRINPARSPAIMGFYIGNSALERIYHKHDSEVITDEIGSILYMNPYKRLAIQESAE
jgi:hypothetical protein